MKIEDERRKSDLRNNKEKMEKLLQIRAMIPESSRDLFAYEIKWSRLRKVCVIK